MTFKIGDQVAVVNELISGTVIALNKAMVTIEDQDGFSREYAIHKLVQQKKDDDYGLNSRAAEQHIIEKINTACIETRQVVISKKNVQKTRFNQELFEIDLHIEALSDDFSYMTNMEILQRQMLTCRMFMERAIQQKAKKVVLIHGKGEGVLRTEIHLYLNRLAQSKSVHIDYTEAAFSDYGGGATTVIIKH